MKSMRGKIAAFSLFWLGISAILVGPASFRKEISDYYQKSWPVKETSEEIKEMSRAASMYISLGVTKEGKVVVEDICINPPIDYDGYTFFQTSDLEIRKRWQIQQPK